MSIEIKRANISDIPRTQAFIREAYAPEKSRKLLSLWRWKFLDNPFRTASREELPVWIAEEDNRIVGQICAIQVELQIGSDPMEAAWAIDLMVLPKYRKPRVASRIIRAPTLDFTTCLCLTAADISIRLGRKRGWRPLKSARVYRKWGRLRRSAVLQYLLYRTTKRPTLNRWLTTLCKVFQCHTVVCLLGNLFFAARDLVRPRVKCGGTTEIREAAQFDEKVADLWERTKSEYEFIVARTPRFLNWRFSAASALDYEKFIAVRNGRVTGYSVLRRSDPRELDFARIVDLFASPRDTETIMTLIDHAIRHFGRSRSVIEVATSRDEYADIFARYGFTAMEKQTLIYMCGNDALRDRLVSSGESCFLTMADHDWDQLRFA